MMGGRMWGMMAAGIVLAAALPAPAHPVPRRNHDRTITVRLTADAVVVDYLLEVDSWTLVFVDLPAVSDKVDLSKLSRPGDFYDAFIRTYAPILAGNLEATADGAALPFVPVEQRYEEKDSIWCTFRFRAPWRPPADKPIPFAFREGNYETEAGKIKVGLAADPGWTLDDVRCADAALQAKAETEWAPGDEEKLRRVSARVSVTPGLPPVSAGSPGPEGLPPSVPAGVEGPGVWLARLLDRPFGLWLALGAAALWGAGHALTPGHGKTLVAAYLVGERGTARHALFLGLVTTLSHTGVLVALGLLFQIMPGRVAPVMGWLPAAGGLLVAGLGVWLLLCRLAGRADHVHLVGGDHDHGGGGPSADDGGPYHGKHNPPPDAPTPGWGQLLVLGLSGGLIPCPSALLLTVGVVNAQRMHLALPLVLAFSAGLAGVLVLLGLAVLYLKGFALSRWGGAGRRVFRVLPLVSALVLTVLGLWMFHDAMMAPPDL